MKCHVCSSEMKAMLTDLPFKIGEKTIVIIKALPVFQCGNCSEYLIEDSVMERVDEMLLKIDLNAELEIISYAA